MSLTSDRDVALVDLADRLRERGVSISGDVVISLAGVDLVYVSLRALVASVETAMDLQLGQDIDFQCSIYLRPSTIWRSPIGHAPA